MLSRGRVSGVAVVAVLGIAATGYVNVAHRTATRPEPNAPAGPPVAACTSEALPTLGGPGGNALDASRNGILTGVADDVRGRSRAVVWRDGAVSALEMGLTQPVPAGVNDDGIVVGSGYDPRHDATVGWAWTAGRTRVLDAATGESTAAEAISGSGRVVGAVEIEEQEQAVVWDDTRASARVLSPLPGDEGGHAFAVAPDGGVGGVSLGDGGAPVVWGRDGSVRRLDSPTGFGIVFGFDDASNPVGVVYLANGESRPTTWNRAGARLRLDTATPGPGSVADGTGADLVAGTVTSGSGFEQAIVWSRSDGRAGLLVPAARTGFHPVSGVANAIGRAGGAPVVVGYSADRRGQRVPTLWRCP